MCPYADNGYMLLEVFKSLNQWIWETNDLRRKENVLAYNRCHIRVIGQMALIEAKVELTLAGTIDVDVYADYEYAIRAKFEELLRGQKKILDSVDHEAWMPQETEYDLLYDGVYVQAYVAQADYVLLAKALKAPRKNYALLREYLQRSPTKRFFDLAKKYELDFEAFLK